MDKISASLELIQTQMHVIIVLKGIIVLTQHSYRFPVHLVLIRIRLRRSIAKYVELALSVSSLLRRIISALLAIIVLQAGYPRKYVQLATLQHKVLLNVLHVLTLNIAPMLEMYQAQKQIALKICTAVLLSMAHSLFINYVLLGLTAP